jgi:hypothetical protein
MLPSPSTAEPSVTTATVLRLMVSLRTASGSLAMAIEMRATPGVYAIERSSRVFNGTLGSTEIVPPRWSRNVRSLIAVTCEPSTTSTAARSFSAWPSSTALHVMSTVMPEPVSTTSNAETVPPASPTAVVIAPIREACSRTTRIVTEYEALGTLIAIKSSRR